MGAIAPNGFEVLDEGLIAELGLTPLEVAAVADRETEELRRREALYRVSRSLVPLRGVAVILVDDGLATGFTMRAAIGALRLREVAHIVVAVPVGAPETCEEIAREIDELLCPLQPEPFHAVGLWYKDFAPTTDDEVSECLAAAQANFRMSAGSRREQGG